MQLADILQGLERLGAIGTATGEGWFTREEAEQATGRGSSTVQRWLRSAAKDGLVEVGKKPQKQIDGVTKHVTAYRFVEGSEDEPRASSGVGAVAGRVCQDRPARAAAR